MTRFSLPLAVVFLLSAGLGSADEESGHERAFWRAIVDSDYAVPEGESAVELLG